MWISIGNLVMLRTIDAGGFGTVSSAVWRKNTVAVKTLQVSLTTLDPVTISTIKQELEILRQLRHDRTLVMIHCCRDDTHIYLVTKYYEKKSLSHLLYERNVALTKESFCILAEDICNGLIYLHNNQPQILHLDLKPKNILIDGYNEYRAVIADFGLSIIAKQSKSLMTIGGTYQYMAPEYLNGNVSDKSDIYSFSIVLWEMLMRKEPYGNVNINAQHLLPYVANGNRPSWQNQPFKIPLEIMGIIETCWCRDHDMRPTAFQLKERIEKFHSNHNSKFLPLM